MKKITINALNLILTIIMLGSALYAVFNIIMTFLPVEMQETVYNTLHMSSEYIATFSVSATINAAVLIASKVTQTFSRIKLSSQLAQSENINVNTVAANEKIVERTNTVINNLNILQELVNALLSVQKVTTERNIKASDKLVYSDEKEAYKQALSDIEEAREKLAEIDNISAVYEKTEVKEVLVEKETDELSGRV